MNTRRSSAAVIVVVATLASSACVRTSEGVPVAESSSVASSATSSAPRSTEAPTTDTAQPEPGVVPTTRAPVDAGTVICSPASKPVIGMLAQVTDPQAPRVIVAVPTGWGMSAGSGDVGARLSGPDGASATVTIAATRLDPDAAFRDYTDAIMDQAPVSTVSILPAELCS